MNRKLLACASLALLSVLALPAQAAHVGVSIGVGVPFPGYYYPHAYPYGYAPYGPYAPYYPPYPYGAPVAPVVVQPAPVVVQPQSVPYVERGPVAQGAPDDSWYFCEKDRAYYPYVKQCAAGWVRVPARPPQ